MTVQEKTPLTNACDCNNVDLVKLLLKAGAEVRAQDRDVGLLDYIQ